MSEDDEQDDVILIREPKHEEIDTEAQADFDRDFAKMLADTTDARRSERKNAAPIFDTAVPLIRRKADGIEGDAGKMAFTLLSKRGNKPQVSGLLLLFRRERTERHLDALVGHPYRFSDRCQFQITSTAKQGGAGTTEAFGFTERAETRAVRNARCVLPLKAQKYRLTWSSARQEDARARGIRLRYIQS